jgi:hypothetical protein
VECVRVWRCKRIVLVESNCADTTAFQRVVIDHPDIFNKGKRVDGYTLDCDVWFEERWIRKESKAHANSAAVEALDHNVANSLLYLNYAKFLLQKSVDILLRKD